MLPMADDQVFGKCAWRRQGGLVVHPSWVLETEELAGLSHPLLTLISPKLLQDGQPVDVGHRFQERLEIAHGLCLLRRNNRRYVLVYSLARAALRLLFHSTYCCHASIQPLILPDNDTFTS